MIVSAVSGNWYYWEMGKARIDKAIPPATPNQVLAKTQEQIIRAIPSSMGIAAELVQNPLTLSLRAISEEMQKSISPSVEAIRELTINSISPSLSVRKTVLENLLTSSSAAAALGMGYSNSTSAAAIVAGFNKSISPSLLAMNAAIESSITSSNAFKATGIADSISSSAAAVIAGIGKSIASGSFIANAAMASSIGPSNAFKATGIADLMSSSAAIAGIGKSIASSSIIGKTAIENIPSPSLVAMLVAMKSSISPSLQAMKGLRAVVSEDFNPASEAIRNIGLIVRDQTKIRKELQEIAEQDMPRTEVQEEINELTKAQVNIKSKLQKMSERGKSRTAVFEEIQELAREQVIVKSKLQTLADQTKSEVDFLLYVQAVAVFQEKFGSELKELVAESSLEGELNLRIRTLASEQASFSQEIRQILADRISSQSSAIEKLQNLIHEQLELARCLEAVADRATPQVDGFLRIKTSPDREDMFGIDVKRNLNLRDLSSSIENLLSIGQELDSKMKPMIVSAFISKSAQEWMKARAISYADATGNFSIVSPSTGTFLSAHGADTDPWKKPGRPTKTLKGKAPAKIVRALIDTSPPLSIPELMKRAKSSSGVAYRAIELLESEGLVVRENRLIVEVNWPKLIERWSEDYSFFGSNTVMSFIYPRGIDAFLDKLKAFDSADYAITGSLAAARLAPYAEARQVMMYATSPEDLAERVGAKLVDSGANVLIASTEFDVVYERDVKFGGLNYVCPSQAAVDLLGGPGRNPAEGKELLEWMVRNEPKWRE